MGKEKFRVLEIMGGRDSSQLPVFSCLLFKLEVELSRLRDDFHLSKYLSEFECAVNSPELVETFESELAALCASPEQGPEAASGTVFAVAETENFLLSLSVLGGAAHKSDLIFTLPNDALICNLSRLAFTGRKHMIPADLEWDLFTDAVRLTSHQEFSLGQLDVASWDGSKHAIEYMSPYEIVLLKLNWKRSRAIQWCFSRNSLLPVLAAACTTLPSRLQVAAMTLSEMQAAMSAQQRDASIKNMRRLLTHELHFVRWTMMQSLFSISDGQPRKELQEMAARDPHPHVREAAESALSMILDS